MLHGLRDTSLSHQMPRASTPNFLMKTSNFAACQEIRAYRIPVAYPFISYVIYDWHWFLLIFFFCNRTLHPALAGVCVCVVIQGNRRLDSWNSHGHLYIRTVIFQLGSFRKCLPKQLIYHRCPLGCRGFRGMFLGVWSASTWPKPGLLDLSFQVHGNSV